MTTCVRLNILPLIGYARYVTVKTGRGEYKFGLLSNDGKQSVGNIRFLDR